MIKQVEFDRRREGTKFDPEIQKWIGYQADITVSGKRLRPVFPTRKKAEGYVDQIRLSAKLKRGGAALHVSPPTVRELLDARLTKIKDPAEHRRCIRIFDRFVSLLPLHAKVTDVRSSDFTRFINSREGEVKLETINREINPISKAFSTAHDLFPSLEDFQPPKVRRPKFKRKRREKIISSEEKDAILAQFYRPRGNETEAKYRNWIRIGRMFELAWFLGMAYKEVATLKKERYNGESLSFWRSKTGAFINFEWLPDEVHELLRTAIADSETDYIFTLSGSIPKSFYYNMRKAVEAAGLEYGRDSGITFHSARHSFVSEAMQHADLKTVGSMTGHSDSVMVMHYSHASPKTRRKALESMYGKKDLREIFEKVKRGEMDFEEFRQVLK